MDTFIGREDELSFLQTKYISNQGELIIVYGRRRIGKTETLRHFCEGKNAVFYTCTQTEDRSQLDNFSKMLLSFNLPQSKYISSFQNWEQAFSAIKDISSPHFGKNIIVIDEFPYMARENTEIPSILQKLWDSELKNQNCMIILCGSSMSYIEKEILSEKNPLYGRATGIYKMLSMSYLDSARFFPQWTLRDKIISHAILGGVPYYLAQFDENKTLKENICSNILRRGSILYSEPEFLLRQELREPTTYNTIIQAIAAGKTSFNEIQQATLVEKGKLSIYLKNLIELCIISREFPLLVGDGEKQNAQRGMYKLNDLFFRFWYKFVFPNYSSLEFGDWENIYDMIVKAQLNDFVSFPFEDICIEWLRFQNKKRLLPFVATKIGKWWSKNTEIDIIAVNAEKSKFISAECKFHNAPVSDFDLEKHVKKDLTGLKKKEDADIAFWYFSFGGYTDKAFSYAKEKGVHLVSGEDLFK